MDRLLEDNFAVFFPLFFVLVWLMFTTILAVMSGWFRLMTKFPNQAMAPLLRLRGQSGSMGPGVSMSRILTLGVCPRGLRVGIMRLFGPLCRDFFVPWDNLRVTRKTFLLLPVAKLQFGSPVIGSLTLPARTANRLARAAMGRWPEPGPFPVESHRETFRRLLIEWAVSTGFVALFFSVVFVVFAPPEGPLSLHALILFVAIVFGVFAIVRYFRERS